ncbi:MAG: class I SAM-dependent RNA methyltransferase, partial [Nitrospiria bacterium]
MNTHGKCHPNSLERDRRANENIPASSPIEKSLPPTEEASADQSLTLKIEKMIYGGWGLARQAPCDPSRAEEGRRVIFVPDVLPGEQIFATLTTSRKGYAKAKLTKILIPSPERKSPPCPVFGTCGGCHLQHMSDTAQLAYKQEVLLETLQRIAHIHASPLPIIASPGSYHYRHRVQFKLFRQENHLKMCYYQRESHHFVPVEGCPILHPDLEQAMKVLRESLESGLPFLLNPTEMHLQYSTHTAQVLIVFYAQEVRPDGLGELFASLKACLPVAGIVAYSKNGRREVRGQPFLLESLKGVTFRISDRTFAQPN